MFWCVVVMFSVWSEPECSIVVRCCGGVGVVVWRCGANVLCVVVCDRMMGWVVLGCPMSGLGAHAMVRGCCVVRVVCCVLRGKMVVLCVLTTRCLPCGSRITTVFRAPHNGRESPLSFTRQTRGSISTRSSSSRGRSLTRTFGTQPR